MTRLLLLDDASTVLSMIFQISFIKAESLALKCTGNWYPPPFPDIWTRCLCHWSMCFRWKALCEYTPSVFKLVLRHWRASVCEIPEAYSLSPSIYSIFMINLRALQKSFVIVTSTLKNNFSPLMTFLPFLALGGQLLEFQHTEAMGEFLMECQV